MDKVRVLAVAPYESMKDIIASIAAARDDVEVTTIVGNMDRGAALVQKCDQSRYDVIISRGSTAERVREVASIPVIDIELTPYDIQNALTAVSGSNRKFAVAGSPGIVSAAATLCDILNMDVEIVPIRDAAEARLVLPQLRQAGVELLAGDMVGVEAAPAAGLDAVLITSGVKGIEDALNKAVSYFSSFGRAQLAAAIHEAELAAGGESLVVFGAAGQLIYAAPEPFVPPAVRNQLSRMLPAALNKGRLIASRPIGKKDYAIRAQTIYYGGERCVAFRFHSEGFRLPVSTPGVRFYDASETDLLRVSRHYGIPGSSLLERAEKIAQSGLPALVCGEKGTLTSSVAGYICMHGLLSQRDCCVVDCAAVGAKGWNKLLGQSGLMDFRTGTTVLFDHLLDMPDREIENLIDFIQTADLTRRLRMVFSLTTGVIPLREEAAVQLITRRLYAAVLRLQPLRERPGDLPAILDNCFTCACADMGVRMPALEEAGRALLLEYSWPRNFPQMFRVVTQLITACDDAVITAGQVSQVLAHERADIVLRSGQRDGIDLSGTLEEINLRVVMQVLAEEGMNRSRTAKRLGISRATLWRILGKEDNS